MGRIIHEVARYCKLCRAPWHAKKKLMELVLCSKLSTCTVTASYTFYFLAGVFLSEECPDDWDTC